MAKVKFIPATPPPVVLPDGEVILTLTEREARILLHLTANICYSCKMVPITNVTRPVHHALIGALCDKSRFRNSIEQFHDRYGETLPNIKTTIS